MASMEEARGILRGALSQDAGSSSLWREVLWMDGAWAAYQLFSTNTICDLQTVLSDGWSCSILFGRVESMRHSCRKSEKRKLVENL